MEDSIIKFFTSLQEDMKEIKTRISFLEKKHEIRRKPKTTKKVNITVNGEAVRVLNYTTPEEVLKTADFIPTKIFRIELKIKGKTGDEYRPFYDNKMKIVIEEGDEFLALCSGPTTVC